MKQQQALLNIQKDVEWLAKQQIRQRNNPVQSKTSSISQGERDGFEGKFQSNMFFPGLLTTGFHT